MIDQRKALECLAELRVAEDMDAFNALDSLYLKRDVWIKGAAILERAKAIARARGAPFRDSCWTPKNKFIHPLPPVEYLN